MNLEEKDELASCLMEDNFINNQRYANEFVHSKFVLKKWGKIKIRQHLKLKHINIQHIEQAIDNNISDEDYENMLFRLMENKWLVLSQKDEENRIQNKAKLVRYLQQKGYELDLIWRIIKKNNI